MVIHRMGVTQTYRGATALRVIIDEIQEFQMSQATYVTGSLNEEIRYEKMRLWKGEDGDYLILTVLGERGSPPAVFERLYVGDPPSIYVVRNVEYDMRTDQATVSCLNLKSWLRINSYVPKPPRFRTQQEADQWLERYAPR